MTREIAIGIIKELRSKPLENRELTALDLAISALEHICDDDCEHCTWTECPEDVLPTMIYPQADGITPTVVAEPCEDAVSREAAIKSINKLYVECEEWRALNDLQYGTNQGLSLAIEVIEDLPSVTVRQTGKWIGIDEEPHEDYECSCCGYVVSTFTANIEPHTEYKYCPNCGADMRGVSE